jgi:hypothetical protein
LEMYTSLGTKKPPIYQIQFGWSLLYFSSEHTDFTSTG